MLPPSWIKNPAKSAPRMAAAGAKPRPGGIEWVPPAARESHSAPARRAGRSPRPLRHHAGRGPAAPPRGSPRTRGEPPETPSDRHRLRPCVPASGDWLSGFGARTAPLPASRFPARSASSTARSHRWMCCLRLSISCGSCWFCCSRRAIFSASVSCRTFPPIAQRPSDAGIRTALEPRPVRAGKCATPLARSIRGPRFQAISSAYSWLGFPGLGQCSGFGQLALSS